MNSLTPCECPAAGWCARHQCEKTPHGHTLCRTRPDYFAQWETARHFPHNPPFPGGGEIARLPCLHRGGVMRTVTCLLCGRRGQSVEVYACGIHGECTLSRWGTSRDAIAMPRCMTCDQRSERSNQDGSSPLRLGEG